MSALEATQSKSASARLVQAAALVVTFGLLLTATRLAPAEAGVVGTVAGLGFLLLAGTLTSELIEALGIPHLTGYLLAGVLAGPDVLALIDRATLAQLGPVNTLALSLIALAGGAELHIELLRSTARSLATGEGSAFSGAGSSMVVFLRQRCWHGRRAVSKMPCSCFAQAHKQRRSLEGCCRAF